MLTLCLAPPGTGATLASRGRHGAASVSSPGPGSGFRVRRRGRAHRRARGVGETPAWPSVARRGLCCPRESAWLPSLRSCAQHVPSLCSSRKRSSGCKGLESRARVWTPACAGEVTALTLLEPSPRRAGTTLGSLSERLARPQRAAPLRRARPAAPTPGPPVRSHAHRAGRRWGTVRSPASRETERDRGIAAPAGAGLGKLRGSGELLEPGPTRSRAAGNGVGARGPPYLSAGPGSSRTGPGDSCRTPWPCCEPARPRPPATPPARPRLLPRPLRVAGRGGVPRGRGPGGGARRGWGGGLGRGGAGSWTGRGGVLEGRGGVLEGAGRVGSPEGSAARSRAAPGDRPQGPGAAAGARARIPLLSGRGAALLGASCAPL